MKVDLNIIDKFKVDHNVLKKSVGTRHRVLLPGQDMGIRPSNQPLIDRRKRDTPAVTNKITPGPDNIG